MNFLFFIFYLQFLFTEAAVCRCSTKQMLLKISQNSQENTYVGVPLLIKVFKKRLRHNCFPVNFAKFFRTFFYRTPLVLLKTESLFPDSLYSNSSFHLCMVVFTYLTSNIQNCNNILLQRIVLDFQ